MKKLGLEAPKYGYTIGIKNNVAIRTLLDRLLEMVERRKNNIWNKPEITIEEQKINYHHMNVPTLHQECKSRGITSAHKKKEEMIALLQESDKNTTNFTENKNEYKGLTSTQLKQLCKDRGLTNYNRLTIPNLIQKLEEDDKDVRKIQQIVEDDKEKEKQLEEVKENIVEEINSKLELYSFDKELCINNIKIIARKSDGYINATQLCKAGGKKLNDYLRLDKTKEYLQALDRSAGYPADLLIHIIMDGKNENRGTWVHRKVAYHLAQWISPSFAVQVSNWLDELFITGKVELNNETSSQKLEEEYRHKLSQINTIINNSNTLQEKLNRTELDLEAEELEKKFNWYDYTNCCVLYVAYIGKYIKLGYSDCGLTDRKKKHTSSTETQYEQFRMIGAFKISSRKIETIMKDLLNEYRISFNKQVEIYNPPSTLKNFIEIISRLLIDNDLKYQLDLLKQENALLKLELQKQSTQIKND